MSNIANVIHGMATWTTDTPDSEVREAKKFFVQYLPNGAIPNEINDREDDLPMVEDRREKTGIMDPVSAAGAFNEPTRTGMLCRAIRDASSRKQIQRVIDAGCGPIPILGLAASVFHPGADVIAIEGNAMSAEAANAIVKGLNSNVCVIQANCLEQINKIGVLQVDLLVSETICAGMRDEKGIQILSALARSHGKNAVMIPERISVRFGLLSEEKFRDDKTVVQFEDVQSTATFSFENGHIPKSDWIEASISCNELDVGNYILLATTDVRFSAQEILSYPAPNAIVNPTMLKVIRCNEKKPGNHAIELSYQAGFYDQTATYASKSDHLKILPLSALNRRN